MKTIGMLGGMSWESTSEYYRIINQTVSAELGGLGSAKCALYSFNFQEIADMQTAGDWPGATRAMIDGALAVKAAGADFVIICTNTMHKMAEGVEKGSGLPLLHIAECTADEIIERGMKKVGLLGTRFTMEDDFYRARLEARGIEALIPDEAERTDVHQVIFGELCQGNFKEESRARSLKIIDRLAGKGAEAIILGCTEIPLLVQQEHTRVPLLDTTFIHASKAAKKALED